MRRIAVFRVIVPAVLCAAATSACYHAIIETGRPPSSTFVESLLATITVGIFTPMTYVVTCAAGGAALAPRDSTRTVTLDVGHATEAERTAITEAARRSAGTGRAVYVRLAPAL